MKAWQRSWPCGRMVDHPSVVAEAMREHPGSRATLRRGEDLEIVTYGSTRVLVDRGAWEMLPPGGVLVLRIRPSYGPSFALAFTADELEAVFGEVRATKSWATARYYSFPKPPPAISSFRVKTRADPDPRDGAKPTSSATNSERPNRVRPTSAEQAASGGSTAPSSRVQSIAHTAVPARSREGGYALDGIDQLTAVLIRAGYPSVIAAVAEHTVFLHPDTVAQTRGEAMFPVIRGMSRRGQIGVDSAGRTVLFDDNFSPTNAFVWAGRISRGRDIQFNHVWSDSSNRDAYTALWNLCATPAFVAKTTDTHPEVTAALRFRAYSLYGALPTEEPEPIKPPGYDDLRWAPHPQTVDDLERLFRKRLRSTPKSRTTIACREIGWLYSGWIPDGTL